MRPQRTIALVMLDRYCLKDQLVRKIVTILFRSSNALIDRCCSETSPLNSSFKRMDPQEQNRLSEGQGYHHDQGAKNRMRIRHLPQAGQI